MTSSRDFQKKRSKLHLGCGTVIKEGWLNHDMIELPGVDVVHDLRQFPWPFDDGQFDEVYMKDVLEHLPDTIKTMEELYRITKPEAKVYITVPYWNSVTAHGDPTHVRLFTEDTFSFFDPVSPHCKDRHYYSTARFYVKTLGVGITPFYPIFVHPRIFRDYVFFNPLLKRFFLGLASIFCNVVHSLDVYLERSN